MRRRLLWITITYLVLEWLGGYSVGLIPFSLAAAAQFTQVTGTVVDPNGLPYANGTISAILIFSGGTPTLNGLAYFPPTQPTGLDANGNFLLSVADNTQLAPPGSQWNFQVCSAGGTIQPAGGKGSVCFSLTTPITISGSAQNISAQLNAAALPLATTSGSSGNNGSIVVGPSTVTFGTVQQGTPSTQFVAVTNTSAVPVTVTGVSFTGSGFSVGSPSTCALAANATCLIPLIATPGSVGVINGTATVNSTAAPDLQQPATVSLSVTGSAGPTSLITLLGLGQGNGTVSDGASFNATFSNGQCVSGCTFSYLNGSTPTLTATPLMGSTFTNGFNGANLSASTSPTILTVTAAETISVTFGIAPTPVTVTLIPTGQGTGTTTTVVTDVNTGNPVNCTQNSGVQTTTPCTIAVNPGTSIVFTGTPALSGTGSCIGGNCTGPTWVGAGSQCSNQSTCTVAPNSNIQISVGYAPPASGAPFGHVQNIPGGTAGTNNITGLWTAAQNAGDTIVLHVLTNSASSTVSSVTDTSGNTYTLPSCGATNPTAGNGLFEALYYAANIAAAAANANTTTVALNASPSYRAIFAEELSGLTSTPLDVCKAANASGNAVASGSITTTVANDYLTGADVVGGGISAVSTGFTQLFKSSGNDYEYQTSAAIGAYNFQPSQTGSGSAAIIASWKTTTAVGALITVNYICAPGSNGSGSVTGSGVNLNCVNGTGTASQVSVGSGSTLTTNANPLSGSAFVTYSGGNCSVSPECKTAPLTTNTTISVNFSNSGQQLAFVNHLTGSDSNSGLCAVASSSCTGPWLTIQHAVNAAPIGATGTVITVHGCPTCVYNEAVTINRSGSSPTARLVLQCDTQWTVGSLTGCSGAWFKITTANNVDIGAINRFGFEYSNASNNTFIDGVTPCAAFSGACAFGNSIHSIGNYGHDIAQSVQGGCPSSGAIIMPNQHGVSVTDIQVIGNVLDHIGTIATGCNVMQGIYIASQGGQVYDNLVFRAAYAGLQYYDQGFNARISNNVFAANGAGMVLYGSNGIPSPGLNTVDNNVVVNNVNQAFNNSFSSDAGCIIGHQTLYSNNIVFGNGSNGFTHQVATCTTVQNQLSENPTNTFTNYTGTAAGTYTLKGGSIANNGGITQCTTGGSTPCVPGFNILGAPNPQSGQTTWNIGAY